VIRMLRRMYPRALAMQILIDAHRRLGNRWVEIAKLLPGRTDREPSEHLARITGARRTDLRVHPQYFLLFTLGPPLFGPSVCSQRCTSNGPFEAALLRCNQESLELGGMFLCVRNYADAAQASVVQTWLVGKSPAGLFASSATMLSIGRIQHDSGGAPLESLLCRARLELVGKTVGVGTESGGRCP